MWHVTLNRSKSQVCFPKLSCYAYHLSEKEENLETYSVIFTIKSTMLGAMAQGDWKGMWLFPLCVGTEDSDWLRHVSLANHLLLPYTVAPNNIVAIATKLGLLTFQFHTQVISFIFQGQRLIENFVFLNLQARLEQQLSSNIDMLHIWWYCGVIHTW